MLRDVTFNIPSADDLIKFLLNPRLKLRFPKSENGGPLESSFDGFSSSAEHVTDDLLHLAIGIFSIKKSLASTFFFSRLNFENVGIDNVTDVVGIKGRLVKIDNFFIKLANFVQILFLKKRIVELIVFEFLDVKVTWRI